MWPKFNNSLEFIEEYNFTNFHYNLICARICMFLYARAFTGTYAYTLPCIWIYVCKFSYITLSRINHENVIGV